MEIDELIEIAKKSVVNCYAPYSKFHVVSVLEAEENLFFVGVNVENVSFGLTVCAERIAVFKAVSEGYKEFSKILIYSPDGMPYPCGSCRQVLAEFCGKSFPIYIASNREIKVFTLGELLPHTFSL
ncbi:cytidine deaminase [Desulfurobacterium indicum]|uniref:Cytidine deaminase n=1 Tax=Desulfurobacterium indicum TaxID=1914305 RepID=A0A1R1MKE1_9BACT|nr:cytidine deaminase [Desulfurobacterium indicum]OMH40170.1 cytidine deaminase [Desulfurobacterium indicum]